MKYYFPTTTLNFTNIISSQMILPPCYYRDEALWWNRFEKTAFNWDSAIVMLNRFPKWDINDPDRDNYPLVISFEGCPMEAKKRQEAQLSVSGKKLKVVVTSVPVVLSIQDLLAGKVEFIFRDEEELNRMMSRAESGVDECKIIQTLKQLAPWAFCVKRTPKDVVMLPLDDASTKLVQDAVATAEATVLVESGLVREERLRGAELGYSLGHYVRSLRSGEFSVAIRDEICFGDWHDEILPKAFSCILDRILDRSASSWDPNRNAVLSFAEACKTDIANSKASSKSLVDDAKRLCGHWSSVEVQYKISEVTDPYLQGLSVFLECGSSAMKYPRYLKSERLKSPEYTLALYGALVGYTSFSRSLLANDNYLPAPKLDFVQRIQQENGQNAKPGFSNMTTSCLVQSVQSQHTSQAVITSATNMAQRIAEERKRQMLAESYTQSIEEEKKVGAVKAPVQTEMSFSAPEDTTQRQQSTIEVASRTDIPDGNSHKLITDPEFPTIVKDFVRKHFAFPVDMQEGVMKDAEYLQREYQPGGRYARNRERNPTDNTSTVRHFVNLLNKSTKICLTEMQKKQLLAFLSERYR